MKRLFPLVLTLLLMPVHRPALAQDTVLEGTLLVAWADDFANGREFPVFGLVADDGTVYDLTLSETEAARLQNAAGSRVRVGGGAFDAREPGTTIENPTVEVIQAFIPPPTLGNLPYANLLCQFPANDTGQSETRVPAFYDTLLGDGYPFMNDFWNEASYGQVTLNGTQTFGWFTMSQSQSNYISGSFASFTELDAIYQECRQLAINAGVDVGGQFDNRVNIMLDEPIGCCAYGYWWVFNGQFTRRMTFMPPFGWQSAALMAHEMGHSFSLPHANNFDGDNDAYDNPWDVMSGIGTFSLPFHPTYGAIPKHTNAYHKDRMGWMNGRKFTLPANGSYVVHLANITEQTPANPQLIQIDTAGSRFYTIEARTPTRYDGGLPYGTVHIYEVDRDRDEHAWLTGCVSGSDADCDGAARLAGSLWLETTHGTNAFMHVLSETATGFRLCVGRQDAACPADQLQGAYAQASSDVQLMWRNNAYNTTGFTIERASAPEGPFTTVGSVAANVTTFVDGGIGCSEGPY